jgi:hypothetical protein
VLVGVFVLVGEFVEVYVGEGVFVEDGVGVLVGVFDGVKVNVGVPVYVGVPDGVGEFVKVGDQVKVGDGPVVLVRVGTAVPHVIVTYIWLPTAYVTPMGAAKALLKSMVQFAVILPTHVYDMDWPYASCGIIGHCTAPLFTAPLFEADTKETPAGIVS